jgi:glycerol-3-phosphate dehydrogenase (NAD(P)+)
MSRIAVIGAGAWGTALAVQAARAGNAVTLWARDPGRAREIAAKRENPRLPGIALDGAITVTADLATCAAEFFLLAVPVQHLRAVARDLPPGPALICAKGIEAGSGLMPSEMLAELAPTRPLAVLTGPNFAAEIASGLPAAAVVAARETDLRLCLMAALASDNFRLYGNDDPIGAELGGASKNVIAIAAGAVIGAGLGENARAALITRGLAEMARLAQALGGRAETMTGLSGLGDLVLTATGPRSRNFSLGLALGQGEALAAILPRLRGVAEGVATAPALVARAARAGCELPICAAVASVLAGNASIGTAMTALLARPRKDE